MGRSAETRGKRDKIFTSFLSVLDKSVLQTLSSQHLLCYTAAHLSENAHQRNGEQAMKLLEVLTLPVLEHSRVVAGQAGLEREVQWVHIVDLPDPLPWVQPGQLLLTTGYAWPREEAAQRALIRALAERNLAGVALAVPHFFEHFSQAAHE